MHGLPRRPEILGYGILPEDTPWFNHGGVDAVGTRFAGTLKTAGGAVLVVTAGASEGLSGGLAWPLAGPLWVAGVALAKSGVNDLKTGESSTTLVADQMIQRGAKPEDAAAVEAMLTAALFMDGASFKSPLRTPSRNPLADNEIIVVGNGAKPGNFILRLGVDDVPIGDLTIPGKSGSIATDLTIESEFGQMFRRPPKRGEVFLVRLWVMSEQRALMSSSADRPKRAPC